MVWQVSFWPRRHTDPHEFNMRDDNAPSGLKLMSDDAVRAEHGKRLRAIMDGLNRLLLGLQLRGSVTGSDPGEPFPVDAPLDWDPRQSGGANGADSDSLEPFDGLTAGSCCFTLWWPDAPRGKLSLLGDGDDRRPHPTDLRVRVQADAGEHFSTVMFIIDTRKPWDGEPIDRIENARVRGILGERRGKILDHVENIRTICEHRLGPKGAAG
jgi:hypothetical protein